MQYIFLSNYYNHHQAPFAEAMDRLTNGMFRYIETEVISEERKGMGWQNNDAPSFALKMYQSHEHEEECKHLINNAEVVIAGSAPLYLLKDRLHAGKLTFRYSERIYKKGFKYYELPARMVKYYFQNGRHKSLYLLCASAYTAADFAKTYTFLNKSYKWGYFPEVKKHDLPELFAHKLTKERPSILWVGRLIGWKHPDASILLAEKLKNEGYDFDLNIIGNGELEQALKDMVAEKQLDGQVRMLGSMSPEKVREHMEAADIFIFTSDFNEGWGAVLNEAMNSGCAVVASHAIGSVPFLIKNGENGLIYRNGDPDSFYDKVVSLLLHPQNQVKLGKAAYQTMEQTWNAEVAAERLLKLARAMMSGCDPRDLYIDGPCSKAAILKNEWYRDEEYLYVWSHRKHKPWM